MINFLLIRGEPHINFRTQSVKMTLGVGHQLCNIFVNPGNYCQISFLRAILFYLSSKDVNGSPLSTGASVSIAQDFH